MLMIDSIENFANSESFIDILASTYGPGLLGPYGPGTFISWKNFLS